MIPKFIESLKELHPKDDVHKACELCNKKIGSYIEQHDPGNTFGQQPVIQCTFKQSLVLSKSFPPAENLGKANHAHRAPDTEPDLKRRSAVSDPTSETSHEEAVEPGTSSSVAESSSSTGSG